ncbi:Uncharacterised protein [Helicobacter fennelliae]|uniref:Uncharacterized protein n=2 Tax=Helicobacter fennelliae TaxID=215 RepID=T1CWB7_9HELI|nr:hypothetical protein [Helicobacter fennelliae]GAD18135.1 hypothetical protein HFN_1733 [Helicobacter fennelliae MRY12-0050]SQB98060.1 Uncharacterised protein [Helicobacter fennelliae]STP06729.1 Uncharacterised protein [Helicobacter fennelliae]STQ83714.1 Uncharacterised protein [Helicobacter fennelliae]
MALFIVHYAFQKNIEQGIAYRLSRIWDEVSEESENQSITIPDDIFDMIAEFIVQGKRMELKPINKKRN